MCVPELFTWSRSIPIYIYFFSELSSSSVHRDLVVPESINSISFYEDDYGRLIPHIAGSFHYVAIHDDLVIGIFIGEGIHRIYDDQRQQILVSLVDDRNIRMTPELHQIYDHYYVPIRRIGRTRSASPRLEGRRHPNQL